MSTSLDKTELTPQELVFLDHYSYTGDKRQALIAAGYPSNLSKDQVYHRGNTILAKAQRSGRWQDTMARHQMSYDELAQKLHELMNCGDKRTELGALQLAIKTTDLLREKPEQREPTTIVFNFQQKPHDKPREKPVDRISIPIGITSGS